MATLRRIPLGGGRATDFLQQVLQLKYPYEKTLFATPRVEVNLPLPHRPPPKGLFFFVDELAAAVCACVCVRRSLMACDSATLSSK